MNKTKYPSTLQIEVTENCNHNCFYCYNHWRTDNPSRKKMTVENAKKLVFLLDKEIKPFGITITGGEPMMNLPAVLEIAKGNIKRGFSLNSNLTMLDETKLNALLETNSNFGILASLPHFESEKFKRIVGVNTLPKFYENLRRIVDNGMKDFIMEKRDGFKIADFPKEYQEKAFAVAEMLMNGGFLYDKKS